MPTGATELAWVWVALAASAPVLAHLFRRRPAPPATFAGAMLLVPDDGRDAWRAAGARRLRELLRLLARSVALGALAAVLLALADPVATAADDAPEPVAIVLDASASTSRAHAIGPRVPVLESLRAEAGRRIDDAERHARPVVLVVASEPRTIATTHAAARSALAAARPAGETDLAEAVALARAAAPRAAEVHLLTDHQATQLAPLRAASAGPHQPTIRLTPSHPPTLERHPTLSPIELDADPNRVFPGVNTRPAIPALRARVMHAGALEPGLTIEWRCSIDGAPQKVVRQPVLTHESPGGRSRARADAPTETDTETLVRLDLAPIVPASARVVRVHADLWIDARPLRGFAAGAEAELRLAPVRTLMVDPSLSLNARAAFEAAALDLGFRLHEAGDEAPPTVAVRAVSNQRSHAARAREQATVLVLDEAPSHPAGRAWRLPPIEPADTPAPAIPLATDAPLLLAELDLGTRRTRPIASQAETWLADQHALALAQWLPPDGEGAPPVLILHADLRPAHDDASLWLPVLARVFLKRLAPPEPHRLTPGSLGARERDTRTPTPRAPPDAPEPAHANAPGNATTDAQPGPGPRAGERGEARADNPFAAGWLLAIALVALLIDLACAARNPHPRSEGGA
ncbi:MAG: hypothetical protein EA378_10145 [Phycisphaerales bacterium]|nr:MAG: hypothetical protein EA378_10145 [Phycisphaerales bacterium]